MDRLPTDDRLDKVAAGSSGECVYFGAYERVGTFSAEVFARGFRTVVVDGIVVTKTDECHVTRTTRDVKLDPQ